MVWYGSTRSSDHRAKEELVATKAQGRLVSRVIFSVGALCLVVTAVAFTMESNAQTSLLLSMSHRTALSALDLSDRLLSVATKKSLSEDAIKEAGELLPGSHRQQRVAKTNAMNKDSMSPKQLLEQAAALEAKEDVEVLRAATKLAQKERHAKEVKEAIHTLKEEAKLREQEKEMQATAVQLKKRADEEFKAAREKAILQATRAIEKAEADKQAAEQPLALIGAGHKQTMAGADEDVVLDTDKESLGGDWDHDLVAKATGTQQLGATGDKFLDWNAPLQKEYDPYANMDPPGTPPKPGGGSAMYPLHHAARGAQGGQARRQQKLAGARSTDEVAELEKALGAAKARADQAEKALEEDERRERAEAGGLAHAEGRRPTQHLAWDFGAKADPLGDDSYAPGLYEDYRKGDLGPLAESKWVPEDHPPSRPACRLHDIDCDELFPWGKPPADVTQPPSRHNRLGDNLIGIFGQDDVVVPTKESGLIKHASHKPDAFAKWPEESRKNKDLLYGLGRRVLSDKYLGVGDLLVPLPEELPPHTAPAHLLLLPCSYPTAPPEARRPMLLLPAAQPRRYAARQGRVRASPFRVSPEPAHGCCLTAAAPCHVTPHGAATAATPDAAAAPWQLTDKFSSQTVRHNGESGLADFLFGSWNQGFHRPHHRHSLMPDVNMFDQPYRQHLAVAAGKGHQVFKVPRTTYKTVGDD